MTRAVLALFLTLLALPALGAEPREYAYLLLQGRLTGAAEGRPTAGASVRLLADGSVHETVTDLRGAFIFEKLPLTTFELEIVLTDGTVLQGRADTGPADPGRVRVVMRPRSGKRAPITISASAGAVAFDVPEPEANWRKFRAETGVFAAVVLLLAL